MKISKLALGFTLTLLGAPAAFAAFVEGTANLEALRAQQSAPASKMVGALGHRFEGSMWDDLRGQQQASVPARAKGMAGPLVEGKGVNARGAEESIYDAIKRDFH